MPLAMGKREIQAEISHFSLLAGDPRLLAHPRCCWLRAPEPPAMKISLSPPSGHVHPCTPRKIPGLATGMGKLRHRAARGFTLRSTQEKTATAASCAPHTSISPLPAPLPPSAAPREAGGSWHRAPLAARLTWREVGGHGAGLRGTPRSGDGSAGSLRNASSVSSPADFKPV